MGNEMSESNKACTDMGNPDMSLPICDCCRESADPNYKLCLTQRIIAPLIKNTSFESVNPERIASH